MDKVQQLLIDLRMRRASIKTMLTNYQMFEETYQEEIDQMLDDLSKLKKQSNFLKKNLNKGKNKPHFISCKQLSIIFFWQKLTKK